MRARRPWRILTPSELQRLIRWTSDQAAARALTSWRLVLAGHPVRVRVRGGIETFPPATSTDQEMGACIQPSWQPCFRASLLSQASTPMKINVSRTVAAV